MNGISRRLAASLLLCVMLVTAASAADGVYSDVAQDIWYYETVEEVTQLRLMNGIDADHFDPEGNLTRAMFVTILGRLEGVDASQYLGRRVFDDVEPYSWCGPYVAWAAEKDITYGTGEGTFSPEALISRQQMATLIYRYAQTTGKVLDTSSPSVERFTDYYVTPVWSRDAVEFMRLTAIMRGDALGNFNPFSYTTRAEAAAVCVRLYWKVHGEAETDV